MDDHDAVVPARRRGLADEVADRIRDAIFGGGVPAAAQLREVELSEALDVSRGPAREALLRLEREGLVRSALTRIGHSTAGYLTRIPDEHRELVAALRARDTATALELFTAHRRLAVDIVAGTTAPS